MGFLDSILRPKVLRNVNPQLIFAALGYMACSSLMLVVNKLAVHHIPAPLMLLFAQLFSTAVCVKTASVVGGLQVDALTWVKVSGFIPAVFIFLLTIALNMKTLQYANVETFIVFRSSTPLALSLCEYAFMNRELPSVRSWLALIGLVLGCAMYVHNDHGFHVKGYLFVTIWYFVFCADQLYLRRIVDVVPMSSSWGRVYYSNLLGCIPLPMIALMNAEEAPKVWTAVAIFVFLLSLVLSTAISYFAWQARSMLSATTFSVLGNVCKVITIGINLLIWDKHANPAGLGCLAVCFVSALFYEQAPMRAPDKAKLSSASVCMDEEALMAAQDNAMDRENDDDFESGSKEV